MQQVFNCMNITILTLSLIFPFTGRFFSGNIGFERFEIVSDFAASRCLLVEIYQSPERHELKISGLILAM